MRYAWRNSLIELGIGKRKEETGWASYEFGGELWEAKYVGRIGSHDNGVDLSFNDHPGRRLHAAIRLKSSCAWVGTLADSTIGNSLKNGMQRPGHHAPILQVGVLR